MQAFADSLVMENLEAANAMIPSGRRWARMRHDRHWWLLADYDHPVEYEGDGYHLSPEDRQSGFRFDQMERMPRTVSDWIAGRARFRVHSLEFAARMGQVTVRYWEERPTVHADSWPIIGYRPALENLVEWPTDE
jgi:hypothetical protein